MYNKFNTFSYSYEGDFIPYTPIVDLGFMSADERIANILTAGMVLQEARADQFGYQNVDSSDNMDVADNDLASIIYCDKMEAHDYAEQLESKKLEEVSNAVRNFSCDARPQNPSETHTEALDRVADASIE
ncbi:MAG: hypothetical protein H9W81_15060 [Enterococcus sp.]|nr:hypothetical protein [Enterococcus sp.]